MSLVKMCAIVYSKIRLGIMLKTKSFCAVGIIYETIIQIGGDQL